MPGRAVAVYCGSRDGASPSFRAAATKFGEALARRGETLVFGGARNGLMGAVGDAVARGGGRLVGVIPAVLDRIEFEHPALSERLAVGTMHERKALMAERADAFVALPGGVGTMDELFEILTWRMIKVHDKPVGLLNVDGCYDLLLQWLEKAMRDGFVPEATLGALQVSSHPDVLLERLLGAA